MADAVFFYGTLMGGFDRRRRAGLDGRMRYTGRGSVSGSLFDLGIYPAAVPSADGRIWGEIYEFDDEAVLAALDDIEGYTHSDPDRSLYMRVRTPVTLEPALTMAAGASAGDGSASASAAAAHGHPQADRSGHGPAVTQADGIPPLQVQPQAQALTQVQAEAPNPVQAGGPAQRPAPPADGMASAHQTMSGSSDAQAPREAWVYIYNAPLGAAPRIPSGDYLAHIRKR